MMEFFLNLRVVAFILGILEDLRFTSRVMILSDNKDLRSLHPK